MPITMHYAGALALIYLVLSLRVIQGRMGKAGPSLGDGGDNAMLRRIRAHGNFSEYVPLILIMMGFLESNGLSSTLLHALGGAIVVARLLHGYAFAFTQNWPFGRSAGAGLTMIVLATSGVLCLIR